MFSLCLVDFKKERGGNTYVNLSQNLTKKSAKPRFGMQGRRQFLNALSVLILRSNLVSVYRKYSRNLKYLVDKG